MFSVLFLSSSFHFLPPSLFLFGGFWFLPGEGLSASRNSLLRRASSVSNLSLANRRVSDILTNLLLHHSASATPQNTPPLPRRCSAPPAPPVQHILELQTSRTEWEGIPEVVVVPPEEDERPALSSSPGKEAGPPAPAPERSLLLQLPQEGKYVGLTGRVCCLPV